MEVFKLPFASEDARPLRILAEYLEPLQAFQRERIADTVVFFGSARLALAGPPGHFYEAAREFARLVTAWSKNLPSHAHRYVVCTGGGGDIMEAANRYGSACWNELINFEALVRHGMIARSDLALFQFADDPATALGLLQAVLQRNSRSGRRPSRTRARHAAETR